MRNFSPLLITLYDGENNYATVQNYTCVGLADMSHSPAPSSLFTLVNDFSLEDPEPETLAGCMPKTATLFPYNTRAGGTERAAVGNKLIERNYSWRFGDTEYDQFRRWRMAQGMPAEGTPEIDNLYNPTILDQWKHQYSFHSCNALLDVFDEDHPALFGSFWHPAEHQSWIDFVKCDFSSTDVWRKNIIRCRTYSPMKVPLYGVRWFGYYDRYSITVRSLPALTGDEYAVCTWTVSDHSDFRADVNTHTYSQLFTAYGDPYEYHTTTLFTNDYRGSSPYYRWKCQVWLLVGETPVLQRESDWSTTLELTNVYFNLSSYVVLNKSSQFIPYYAYLTSYGKTDGYSVWSMHIQTFDEDIINLRVQVSTDPNFATTYSNTTTTPLFPGNSEGVDWASYPTCKYCDYLPMPLNVPSGEGPFDDYYCRVRGENASGSVVGNWSEVFTLTYTPHAGYTTSRNIGISGTLVEETHDESVSSYAEEQEFIIDGGTTLATILEDGVLYLYAFDSTDGSQISKTEVPGASLYNLVRFGGKVYALSWNGWREVTDGVLGDRNAFTYPATGYLYPAWTFLTNLYGHLQLCSSLSNNKLLFDPRWGLPIDNNNKFRLGTMAILEGETEFTVHDDIITGRHYSTDPWHGSFWYEVDGRFETTNLGYRIAWLQGPPVKVFPWVGRFQLSRVI